MRNALLALASLGALALVPAAALADEGGAAAGAATGAVTGAIVGGPIGAAVGAGVGGIAGGAASGPDRPDTVVVQPGPAPVKEKTCVEDAGGTKTCHEVVR